MPDPLASARDGERAISATSRGPLVAKLARPPLPAVVVPRRDLTERLETAVGSQVVSILAPAGYGKTTLLRLWADQTPRSAFVTLDAHDNDPVNLLTAIATALDQLEPLDPGVLAHLATPGRPLESALLPELLEAVWRMRTAFVLMLDDVHALIEPAALDALGYIMLHLPTYARLALASRHAPPLPWARLRVAGVLLEFGTADLALDEDAVRTMASAMGVTVSPERLTGLLARTEGWPAATYLRLRVELSDQAVVRTSDAPWGTEASIAEYMRAELLRPLDPDLQRWLMRSSVLETMTGPLCDAALATTGSLARLRSLERDNLLVVPLDPERRTYRHHQMFRDLLRDELDVLEPETGPAICSRASAWHADHGDPERAVAYAQASGNLDSVARLIERFSLPLHWTGRTATVASWLRWLDREATEVRWVGVAVLAGFVAAMEGRLPEARRWLAIAEHSPRDIALPDGSTSAAWLALLRGFMAPAGVDALRADAQLALDGIPATSPFRQTALLVGAFAHLALGSVDAADALLEEALGVSEARQASPGIVLALGERAVIALARNDTSAASRFVERGLRHASERGIDAHAASAVLHAASIRTALASQALEAAREAVKRVNRFRPVLTAALPVLSLQMRLVATRGQIAMRDLASARTLVLEAKDILRRCPDMGALVEDVAHLERELDGVRAATSGSWALTPAELRLLAYLPTHLTVREIAERMYLSSHTVKSQLIAVYSKLGASSRRAAIELAVEAGLIDGSVLRYPDGPTGVG